MKKKLEIKDVMNIGIFVAIYFVAFFASMMIGYIPALMTVLTLVSGIVCGIPFMLFLARVDKFGMLLIFGVLCGVLSLLMGSGLLPLTTAVIASLAAEIVLKSGKYISSKKAILAYMVFSLWFIGYGMRLYISTSDAYMESIASTYGQEYTSAMLNYVFGWSFWSSIILTLVGGFLGGILGTKVLKKHFKKAGIV